MKFEVTKEIKEAIQSKSIDFKKIYGDKYNAEYKELEYLAKNDIKTLRKKTGILFPFVYKKFGGDIKISNDDIENAKMIGLNPNDLDYITDLAISAIIEDRKLKFGNDLIVTEMLQPENIIIVNN